MSVNYTAACGCLYSYAVACFDVSVSQDFSVFQVLFLSFLFLFIFTSLLFFSFSKNRITSSLCQDEFDHVGSSTGQLRREIQNLKLKFNDLYSQVFLWNCPDWTLHFHRIYFPFELKTELKMLTWFPAELHGLLLSQLFYIKLFYIKEGLVPFASANRWFL